MPIFTNSSETRSYQPGPKISDKLHDSFFVLYTLTHLDLLILPNFTSALSANYSWCTRVDEILQLVLSFTNIQTEIQLIQTPKAKIQKETIQKVNQKTPEPKAVRQVHGHFAGWLLSSLRWRSCSAEGSEKMTEMVLGESLFETKWWVKRKTLVNLKNYFCSWELWKLPCWITATSKN